jgi:hypothetical protein
MTIAAFGKHGIPVLIAPAGNDTASFQEFRVKDSIIRSSFSHVLQNCAIGYRRGRCPPTPVRVQGSKLPRRLQSVFPDSDGLVYW